LYNSASEHSYDNLRLIKCIYNIIILSLFTFFDNLIPIIKICHFEKCLLYTAQSLWSNFRPFSCLSRRYNFRLPHKKLLKFRELLKFRVKIAPNSFTTQQSVKFTPLLGRFYPSKFTVWHFLITRPHIEIAIPFFFGKGGVNF
jgi:hypothetical protein